MGARARGVRSFILGLVIIQSIVTYACSTPALAKALGNYTSNGGKFSFQKSKLSFGRGKQNFFKFRPPYGYGKFKFGGGHFPSPPGQSLNVKTDFGARGDGITDDQNAISAGLAAAKATGKALFFPPGTYLHSGLLVADSAALFGVGHNSVLVATGATGAVELTGNNASISLFAINGPSIAQSSGSDPSKAFADAVWIQSANNFAVTQVTINGSGYHGIDIVQSSNGSVTSSVIANIADLGIAIWDCYSVQILNNSVQNAGRTALYVSTLTNNGNGNLFISNNAFVAPTTGPNQSITLTAVQNSSFTNNSCVGYCLIISNASITAPVTGNLFISGNGISGVGGVLNSAIYVGYAIWPISSYRVDGVTISNNILTDSQPGDLFGTTFISVQTAANVQIVSNSLNGTRGQGIVVNTCNNTVIHGNSISNLLLNGIGAIDSGQQQNTGSMEISNNTLSNCSTFSANPIIDVTNQQVFQTPPPAYASLAITNNVYTGPANQASYFIECTIPSSIPRTISGNVQTTTNLPNNIAP